QLVQLEQAVGAVAGGGPARDDEAAALEVTQHARRPARPRCGLANGRVVHGRDLNTTMSGFGGALAAVAVLEPHDVVEVGRRDLEDRGVLEGRDPVDRARTEAEACSRADDLLLEDGSSCGAELDLGPALADEPGLVLDPMELEAQR